MSPQPSRRSPGARAAHSGSAAHDESGIAALVARLRAWPPTLVVLEATGGREVPRAAALASAGVAAAVVNPRQVRAVGRAVGQLAKTDALDALDALDTNSWRASPRWSVRRRVRCLTRRRRN